MSIIFLPAFMVCLAWFPRSRILQPVMASIFLLHFFISMNLHSAFEWKNNADNLKLFEQLQTIKEIPQGRLKIFVAAGEDFFSVLNYYRITKQWNYLEQVFHDQGRMNPHADYFVIRANDFQKYKALPAEIVYQDLNTGNTLCRNSMLINEKPISVFQTYKSHDKPDQEVFEVKPEDEFAGELLFPAIQDSSESIQYIRATLEIFPEKAISNSTGLILSFECADSTCDYRYFNLYDRLQGQSGKWIPLEIVYPEITELVSQARIKIYLWNNNGLTFKFRNLKGERLRYGER